jgi:hypothetical protein
MKDADKSSFFCGVEGLETKKICLRIVTQFPSLEREGWKREREGASLLRVGLVQNTKITLGE